MRILTVSAFLFALTACGGGEAAPAEGASHEAGEHKEEAKPAEAAPAAADAAAAAAEEPVICCEFNGAVGTSTKSLCDSYKGTVVADDKCKK